MEAFFVNSVRPALHAFAFASDPATIDPDGFQSAMMDKVTNMMHHKLTLDGVFYGAFSLAFRLTLKDRLFYYGVYAMSVAGQPLGPYGVVIKSDGEYRTINDLATCSRKALLGDVKQSYRNAKTQFEN